MTFKKGDRVTWNGTGAEGTVTGFMAPGLRIKWDDLPGENQYRPNQLRNLEHVTTSITMPNPGDRVRLKSDHTRTAHVESMEWDSETPLQEIMVTVRTPKLRLQEWRLSDLEPIPKEEPPMAKKITINPFNKGDRVRSTVDHLQGLTGTVKENPRPSGTTTLVHWDGEKNMSYERTAKLYHAPNTPKATGQSFVTLGEGVSNIYKLPAMTITEEPSIGATTLYKGIHTSNGVHESVGIDYCLAQAAEWVEIAHRINQKTIAKANKEREAAAAQLVANARELAAVYIECRDDNNSPHPVNELVKEAFDTPDLRNAWLAVATAARQHYAPKEES